VRVVDHGDERPLRRGGAQRGRDPLEKSALVERVVASRRRDRVGGRGPAGLQLGEELGDRPQRRGRVFERGGSQAARPAREPAAELVDGPRLPGPRVAGEERDRAVAGGRAARGVQQRLELAFAADEARAIERGRDQPRALRSRRESLLCASGGWDRRTPSRSGFV